MAILRMPWQRAFKPAREPRPEERDSDGPRLSPYRQVDNHEQIAQLASELLSSDRDYVVAGITSIPHESVPSIDADALRSILPPSARIYFIPSGSLTFKLMSLLPDHRAPYNRATRLWIPGGDWQSDRFYHPQVYDDSNQYGPRAIRELAYKLRHAIERHGISAERDPVAAYRELEMARLQAGLERHSEAVAHARSERDLALHRAELGERRARDAEQELAWLRARVLGERRPGSDPTARLTSHSCGASE